jgi:hypothetical protein
LPFWHTTVVVEPCGTTTVVFCGGGGFELLMHPASNPAAAMALNNIFIVDSWYCRAIAHRKPQLSVAAVNAGRSV